MKQRLERPEVELDVDQGLACLDGFVSLGLEAASNAEGKNVLVTIGNTGAGMNSGILYCCAKGTLQGRVP